MLNFTEFVNLYQAYEKYVAQSVQQPVHQPVQQPADLAVQLAALQSTVDKIANRPPMVNSQPKVQTIDDIILDMVK